MKRSFVELSRAAFGKMPQSQAQAHQNRDAETHVCRGQSERIAQTKTTDSGVKE